MSSLSVLGCAAVVFVFIRAICEPRLRPGKEIWDRVLGLEPADAAVLAGVRFVGTFSLLVGLGAGIGVMLTWWVESLDLADMGSVGGQEAVNQVEELLALFAVFESTLSRLGWFVSIACVVLFAVGLFFWSARSRRGVGKRIRSAVKELQELARANKLPYIPPDDRMRQADEAIAAAHAANAGSDIIETLYGRRLQYDVVRRLDPRLLLEVGDPLPGPPFARVLRFLISAPLLHQVKSVGRIASTLLMLALVPASLVVVASADLNKAMDEKQPALEALAAALTLEVDLGWDTSSKGWPARSEERTQPRTKEKQAKIDDQDGPPNRPARRLEPCEAAPAASACAAAAEFGVAFEAAWGRSLLNRSGTSVAANVVGISDARRAWARRQVLLESVIPRAGTVNVAEAASDVSDLQVRSGAVIDAELKARTGSGPVTSFGNLARKIFRELTQGGPRSFERAARPLSHLELASTAVAASVGLLIDGIGAETESTLSNKLLGSALKEAVGKFAEEVERRPEAVKQLRRSAELSAMHAASQVRDATVVKKPMGMVGLFTDPYLVQSFGGPIDQVTHFEFPKPSVTRAQASVSLEAAPSSSVDWRKVEIALRQYEAEGSNPSLDSLASYSSRFPGIRGQRAQTEEARIARVLDPDRAKVDYGRPPESHKAKEGLKIVKATEVTRVAKIHLDLARSFLRLRSYHGVGGVLVGRDPTGEKGLDLVGVDFSVDNDRLSILLTHADGMKTAVGPYDAAVAHLALVYAADGRPVTVTFVSARPLTDRKILLHPALVDTEVGCHAIRLDQFVDRFGLAGQLKIRWHTELVRRKVVVSLYRLAWRARLSEWFMDGRSREELSDEESRMVQRFVGWESLALTKSEIADAVLSDVEVLAPLRQRPRLFDPKLVEILDACLVERESELAPTQCVEERAKRAGRTFEGRPKTLVLEQPSIEVISGVREDAYELDEGLAFAQVPPEIWSGPLRFVLLSNVVMTGSSTEAELKHIGESEPWEFEATKELLDETVLNAVRVRPEALRTFRVMQEFTVSQRLFRAAFDGRLGKRFPVERLVEIVRETAPHVDFGAVKTDRWLLRDVARERPATPLREALDVPTVQQATCLGSLGADPP